MLSTVRSIERRARRTTMIAGLAGLAAVSAHNIRLWRRDAATLADARREVSLNSPIEAIDPPRVSALVAAWNETNHIDPHIDSFLALTYPNIELIVCAGGNDDTYCRAGRRASERVIVIEQRAGDGKQRSLARCLEHATGEIIYLTDADCLYDDDALDRVLAPLISDGEHASTGTSRPLRGQLDRILPFHVWAADAASSLRTGAYIEGLLGRNAAVSRAALDEIGGLDFEARTGTDYQLARRLLAGGFRIRFVRESVVESEYPTTIRAYRQKQSRWLRNLILHGPRYGASHDVRVTRKTIATGLAMTFAPLVALPLGISALTPWGLLVAHASAARIRYARLASRQIGRDLPARYVAWVVPLTMLDFAVWALPLVDLLRRDRRERW